MDMFQGRMDIAVEHGADVAIFVHNLVYWVEKNAANGKHFHDGRYWTYNSVKALMEMYPLWSASQIRTITQKAEKAGLIVTGNYNQKPMDRTMWYSPSDEVLKLYGLGKYVSSICEKSQMDLSETANAFAKNDKAIPSIYQEDTNNPPTPPEGDEGKKKSHKSKFALAEEAKPVLRAYVGEDKELANALADFLELRETIQAVNSEKAIRELLRRLDELSQGDRTAKLLLIRQSIANSWKSVFPLKGYMAPPPQQSTPSPTQRKWHTEVVDGTEEIIFD